ncbi:MAG TPA: endonuclease/exonuclease/phosphatase family protein, partial [Anaerolineae bacterium]
ALTVLFGVQMLRMMLPLFVYVLRDGIGWSAVQVGSLALAVFLTAFLAAFLWRGLGPRRSLIATAGGLGLFRLALQLWQACCPAADPLVDLVLAAIATILFLWFIPVYLGHVRPAGTAATGRFTLGLLIGLTLDTALYGAYGTYDMSWRAGIETALLVLLLVLAQWALLAGTLRTRSTFDNSDTSLSLALPWLAFGPFLFLHLLVFQNIARLTTLMGGTAPLAFIWTLASHLLGIATAIWLLRRRHRWAAAVLGLILFASFLIPWPAGALAALFVLLGQVSSAGLLALIVAELGAGAGRPGVARITTSYSLGIFLMGILAFLYYLGFDVALPFRNVILPPLAALIVGLAGVSAARLLVRQMAAVAIGWRPFWLALPLLLLPLGQLITWDTPAPVAGNGFPVRVMTYNLHNGFDPEGNLGMEAIAHVIEAQRPDVVALQEVSRGWVINGSVDMLTWLSQRLDMPYVYGPTADLLWGNAILSRYPILRSEMIELPPDDLLLRRGFIRARIDVGSGQHLTAINTHFHHVTGAGDIRLIQAQATLDLWQGQEKTVIMGDLNAVPGDAEIELLRQAGLADALDLAGIISGFTNPAANPSRRIDYIWVSPDLSVAEVVIPPSTASDHLSIVATVNQ